MDWSALFKTAFLCLVSLIIEIISATKSGKKWFVDLRQPEYSFSLSAWYFIGGLYYLAFGTIAYRQFHTYADIFSLPVILLTFVMLINGLSNFILFKYRSLKIFYIMLYPFCLLVIWLVTILLRRDTLSAELAIIYLIWLIYDIYYFYSLWKLNTNGI
jgi:tryptophan-rich sensory protein